ncbi:MAG: hypothetical protein EOR08_12555 [Mesorhizobium sp.]|nr:MAG: hypothetical protein EOR04_16355 [Mesorhizobium sp.]RWP63061.1 MAG: hypothetical protein EOR08_12555 [Mesorhizobium sp.]
MAQFAAKCKGRHVAAQQKQPRRAAVKVCSNVSRPFYYIFVILGRSKERSDAAQTLGSMP